MRPYRRARERSCLSRYELAQYEYTYGGYDESDLLDRTLVEEDWEVGVRELGLPWAPSYSIQRWPEESQNWSLLCTYIKAILDLVPHLYVLGWCVGKLGAWEFKVGCVKGECRWEVSILTFTLPSDLPLDLAKLALHRAIDRLTPCAHKIAEQVRALDPDVVEAMQGLLLLENPDLAA